MLFENYVKKNENVLCIKENKNKNKQFCSGQTYIFHILTIEVVEEKCNFC